jgi:3-deoxy-manno-octulosonate cytidylyltransferase (CMP-KDO synthetase)
VEHHGNNPIQNVVAIIPARYASIRLPGKMLLPIAGKPLILHTLERAREAEHISRVVVATDDERISRVVIDAGHEAVMTSPDHQSGSDRIAEVAEGLPEGTIVVNVQGDEPLISPKTIDAAVEALFNDGDADIVTTCSGIESKQELLNGNVVKVVVGDSGYALYFSRSPMPFPREASMRYNGDPGRAIDEEPELLSIFRKHTGLYVYRREYLLKFTELPQTRLETIEMLEQLRALEDSARIRVVKAPVSSIGVDTWEDLDRVRLTIEFPAIRFRDGNAEDLGAISDVYIDAVRNSYGFLPSEYLKSLSIDARKTVIADRAQNESYRLLVAEDGAKGIVGFIDYARPAGDNFGCDGRIFSFYLRPEMQRRGLGGLLFRYCFERMKRECYQSVCLDTFEANRYGTFYKKMNGSVFGNGEHLVFDKRFPTVVYGWEDLSKVYG